MSQLVAGMLFASCREEKYQPLAARRAKTVGPAMAENLTNPVENFGKEGLSKLDVGLVGTVKNVNAEVLTTLCSAGTIPVIAPVACDKTGGKLNVNADSAAGMVAAAVKAEKLVMVSDTHGIYTDMEDESTRISSASEKEVEKMVAEGIITSGMMPKVDACFTALNGGVKKAHIIDGRIQHSLLLEIYTDQGIGTQIIN